MRRFLALLAVLAATFALVACGDDDTATGGTSAMTAGDATGDTAVTTADEAVPAGSITVFAAASLTDAFAEVADAFEAVNPGVSVRMSFAGSSSLREQILEGAPADVFAPANHANMGQVVDAGEVEEYEVFVTNSLQIVVPAGNPAGIAGLDDFARSELLIGLCAAEVPCGDFGRQALAAAGVSPSPDTNEPDVRALLTKVEAGELDAGLVYVTDVVSAGDSVEGIDLPDEFTVVAAYAIGTVTSSGNPEAATAFVEFVLSDEGQGILGGHGFGQP
jgi:molybdate transport system substrate-binding protein